MRKFFLFFWVPALAIQTGLNALFHLACTVYYLFVAPPSRSISSETRQAQRRFFIGIMIHTLIPLLVLGIPPLVLIVSVLTDNYRQEYTNLCMTLLGFNGLIESLAILLVHRPYRFAVKEIFCFRKLKDPKVYAIPVYESSSSRRVNLQI
ncbi:hypothetical protein B9Z55_021306 [Caenorhabditis nigoni]|uniref:G-protein coupled receptors family 1 profile domain-containing protein n=1 Tax=Caenorhabditis nigoni TaxID=1611254 RepID=A0A2G5TRK7_9PELO|nr:hypothetical protein B9Z55_021306 [Caenorhabditis nigoni]